MAAALVASCPCKEAASFNGTAGSSCAQNTLHSQDMPKIGTALLPDQVDGRQRLRYPPAPLATLALQKEAITHLRLPGERTMKLAEELYQEGAISYPRTETDVFDPSYDLKVSGPS